MTKRNRLCILACLGLTLTNTQIHAQEVIKKGKYTLTYKSNDQNFDPALKEKLIATFFEVYPKLAKEYNPKTLKAVTFFIDTAYKGVAATSNGVIIYSPVYMSKHPGDIDVVTHEGMHIVQNYGRSVGPGWLTEGIADYVRYKFGIDNPGAKWTLPELKPEHSYKNSYRITARFFVWMEKTVKPGMIKTIDQQLRDHTYTAESWNKLTGKNLDELWAAYVQNPSIS
jgi:hypothetical protein